MHSLQIRKTLFKAFSASAVAAVMLTGLTGCAGGGDNGQYLGKARWGSAQIVEVDGDKLYFDRHWQSGTCGGKEFDANNSSDYSVGQISNDRTSVTWIEEGTWSGTDPLRIENGVMTLGDKVFTTPDKSSDAKEVADDCIIPKTIKQPGE